MGSLYTELCNILPFWLRDHVDKSHPEDLQEIRLRLNDPAELKGGRGSVWLERNVSSEDLSVCMNMATKYSPWTSSSMTDGYITAPGGHRIGICGECSYDGNTLKNISQVTSLCIRVAKEIRDVSGKTYQGMDSVLIIGCPGSGKTTFLRDLIRKTSDHLDGAVTVVDERRELFPAVRGRFLFDRGKRTDILSGCKKSVGLDMAIRTMGPAVVAVDEITEQSDCMALCRAARCGVRLFATAHAGDRDEFFSRKLYEPLLHDRIFQRLIVMRKDKTWTEEVLTV